MSSKTYFESIEACKPDHCCIIFHSAFEKAGFQWGQIKARDIFIYSSLCEDFVHGRDYDLEKAAVWASLKTIRTVKKYIKKFKEIGLMDESGAMVDISTLPK